jgi:tetratricopeptide (TPR) repeat protein
LRPYLLVAAAALAAFAFSLGGSFHFDDYALFSNASLTSWTAIRPLTNLTFRLNLAINGNAPFGYHLVNLVLHAATAALLLRALGRVLPARAALAGALVFAVHPAAAEPVNYVFARGTLLAGLLLAVALGDWLAGRHWAAVAWFAGALLAKEESAGFPLFLFLLHLSVSRNRRELAAIGAMALLALAAGLRVIAATSQVSGAGAGFSSHRSPLEYFSMQGIAILRYAQLVVAPWGYTIDPDLPPAAMWVRAAAWLAVAGGAAICLRSFERARAGFWVIGALALALPGSSVFPADDLAADRRLYLPMMAVSAALGLLLSRANRPMLVLICCALAGISVRYCFVWQTERRLWSEAVARAPGKARPLLQLSRTSESAGEALALLAKAQSIAPDDASVASEQGRVLVMAGRTAEALGAFGRALALSPNSAAAFSNRGAALAAMGQAEAARQDFERALRIDPCQFDARLNLKRSGGIPPPANCRYTAQQEAQLAQ